MKRSDILLAFLATGALVAGPALAKPSRNETAPMHMTLMEARKKLNHEGAGGADGRRHIMECSRYITMNAAGQTETVDSMRSKMPAANMMASSHEMAKKVATSCKNHAGMMVHEVMENVMPQTNVMP